MNSRIKKKLHKRGGIKSYNRSRIKLLFKAHHMYYEFGKFISLSKNNKHMHFSKASLIIGKDGIMRLRYRNKRKRREYRRKNI